MSGRGLSATTKTEIAKPQITIALLVKLEFDDGDVTVWTGIGSIQWSGDTYLGGGQLLAISSVKETIDVRAEGVTVTLSGIPASYVSTALGENYQGRPATIYMGFLNQSTLTLVDNPAIVFSGIMDTMSLRDNGKTSDISVALESKLIRMQVPNESRYTNAEQLSRFPQDHSFKFIASQVNQTVYWGDVSKSR